MTAHRARDKSGLLPCSPADEHIAVQVAFVWRAVLLPVVDELEPLDELLKTSIAPKRTHLRCPHQDRRHMCPWTPWVFIESSIGNGVHLVQRTELRVPGEEEWRRVARRQSTCEPIERLACLGYFGGICCCRNDQLDHLG